jgi:acetylornithine/N-succinyldiaminopimelate aminotransferase
VNETNDIDPDDVERDDIETDPVEAGDMEAGDMETGDMETGDVDATHVEAGDVEAVDVEAASNDGDDDQVDAMLPAVAPELAADARVTYSDAPQGLRRADADGLEIVDAMAGRSSVFGFGHAAIVETIAMVADQYLGPEPTGDSIGVIDSLRSLGVDDAVLRNAATTPSADLAIEQLILLARSRDDGRRYRTLAMIGSDHGRTAMCRTASGKPELHHGFGPMMAGFGHVPVDNLKAIESQIDDQTGSVLICPVDFANGCRAATEDFLIGLRQLCDKHDLLLIVDETQLVLGATGAATTFQSIADVTADAIAFSAGCFGGMPGGLWIAGERVTDQAIVDVDAVPMLALLAKQTLATMIDEDILAAASADSQPFAVTLAETIAHHEFVRDVHATGRTIGIETDIDSADLVRIAARCGLHVEAAGDLAIRLQPPLLMDDDDRQRLIDGIGKTFAAAKSMTAELTA